MPLIAVICVTFGVSSSSMWSRTHTMLQVWFLPRFEGKKAFWKPWTGAVWWTNWVFTIQGGHISIYAASLFKIHTQSIHFAHCIVLIMGFICFWFFFLSSSSYSIKKLNARKCAQKPTKKEPDRIWPNWIFLRWECSLITSTTGWYLILGFTDKWVNA